MATATKSEAKGATRSADKVPAESAGIDPSVYDNSTALLALRDRLGNRGFRAVLRGAAPPRDDPLQSAGARLILQRKCACGASSSDGECTECSKKKLRLQTKLHISEPGDVYEQEADRVAEQVMRMPEPDSNAGYDPSPSESGRKPLVQRRTEGASGDPGSLPDDFARSLGPSRPLPAAARAFFEPRFGRDLGDVRVHAGSQAAQAARSVDARAFTVRRSIAFGEGQYAPDTRAGRELLAHELAHVVQQSDSVQRKPDDKKPILYLGAVTPRSSAIRDVIAFFTEKFPTADIKQYYVVDKNTLTIYDKDGNSKAKITLQRPGVVDVTGYYFGSPYYDIGWAWVKEKTPGTFFVEGLTRSGQETMKGPTDLGTLLQALNEELYVPGWVHGDDDIQRFWANTQEGLTAMAVMNMPPARASSSKQKEGPVLRHDYPAWFKELKNRVEKAIVQERKANKANPLLPDKIYFYGSDKVQAKKGADAWTIEVEKGKREAYLTVEKAAWDEAEDKEAYTQEVIQELYKKVQLMIDEAELQKQEEKEITEIDSTGARGKRDKWAWALALKKQIEALLNEQKNKEPDAKDFPDQLTLSTDKDDAEAFAYLRVWVYKEKKDEKADALPELIGGTLPTALKQDDKAENWAPIVRKAADAMRKGRVTTEAADEAADATGDFTVLPAYPAIVHPYDLNPDRTTATIATNTFRMVVRTDLVHGTNTLNLATIHMGMSIGYSWRVYPLPEQVKALEAAAKGSSEQYLADANDYVRKNSESLGQEKQSYEPDYDRDQEVEMSDLGEGEFLMLGKASIRYPSDWNMKRQPSVAGVPFTVMKAEDLAAKSAYADSDALKKLKEELAKETDEKKKDFLQKQIADLEAREQESDLLKLTKKDAEETLKLINKAGALKKFIEDDRRRNLRFSGGRDYNPFMLRLKAFRADPDLYPLYILVRQVFDYRYGDLYAIDEYTKLVQQQYDDLIKLEKRTVRMMKNQKVRTDLPQYRCVAALVKKDDGNLVPLILVVGHHADSKPDEGKYKMMVLDVTFDAKKDDMTYVGGVEGTEKDAVQSAFVEFGDDNHYGNGEIVYWIPKTGYRGQAHSITTPTEYLGYALAAIGIVLLIAGAILSGGTLAPASAGAIGAIVTALGISAGVAGAVLAARNIYKRVEKGTFELDAAFALDVIAIVGAVVQVAGVAGRLSIATRTIGAVQRAVQIEKLDKVLAIYNWAELGGNVIFVGLKVKQDVDAVRELGLPKEQEDEMMQQIAMEAVQQGAMLAVASFTHINEVANRAKARVENSPYQSFRERGWVDEHGKVTESAPPFLREHAPEPGKAPSKAALAEQTWKETQVLDMAVKPTEDNQHQLTVTENGRIIRCSTPSCTDLRLNYGKVLERDPAMNKEMADLEIRAQEAAKSGSKAEADKVAIDAKAFEAKLKRADDLHRNLFGATDAEVEAAQDSIESGEVTGGPKSGRRIEGRKIPRRQRRQIDVIDIMTEAELKDLGKGGHGKALDRASQVMGKKISEIPELKKHWEAARSDVLKGKEVTAYTKEKVIKMYKEAQRKFWDNVRKDPGAVDFLKKQGFELEGKSGAAMAVLGPEGKLKTERGHITDQERRISLDHSAEKAQAENWTKSLDADNLELMFQNANSQKEIVQVRHGMRKDTPTVQKSTAPVTDVPAAPVQKPAVPGADIPTEPVQKPAEPGADIPAAPGDVPAAAQKPTVPGTETPAATPESPQASAEQETSGIPKGGVPISERVKKKGVKLPKHVAKDPEGYYYDPKSKSYVKIVGKPKAPPVVAETEAEIAARAKAQARLAELQAQRTTKETELTDLIRQRDKLRAEHNQAVEEQKQAAKERSAALGDEEAYAAAKQKGSDAKARAEAAQSAMDKLPSEEDVHRSILELGRDIEVESIKADPKSRAKLPCFAGETLVATPTGLRRIDALRVNDLVLAFDFSDAAPCTCRVTQTHLHAARDFVAIDAAGVRVRATRSHRFWVEDGVGWLPASALRAGMRVRSPDGRSVELEAVAASTGDPEPSYNLSVGGPATYFVGAGVLVHNGPVDVGLGANYIIYRATNKTDPEFADKVYIGQTTELDSKGRPRGTEARGGEHQENAAKKLADHEAGLITLSKEDQDFYRFMKDAELEPIVRGIATKEQADYLEQLNIEAERKLKGPHQENVINRREQIASESHMKEVVDAIVNDPAVKARGYCP